MRHTRYRDSRRVRTGSSVDFVCDRFDIDAAIVPRCVQASVAVGIASRTRAIAASKRVGAHRRSEPSELPRAFARPDAAAWRRLTVACGRAATTRRLGQGVDEDAIGDRRRVFG
ncbi:hypothetical protein [Lysobacter antibioticus]|uniref:hypothetical protein n=1 Tax=Lysobacter antibioticus TaxID=84531 RepID=UPI0011873262|nr:hypothetical protein [Lysobacter antibioticus]